MTCPIIQILQIYEIGLLLKILTRNEKFIKICSAKKTIYHETLWNEYYVVPRQKFDFSVFSLFYWKINNQYVVMKLHILVRLICPIALSDLSDLTLSLKSFDKERKFHHELRHFNTIWNNLLFQFKCYAEEKFISLSGVDTVFKCLIMGGRY